MKWISRLISLALAIIVGAFLVMWLTASSAYGVYPPPPGEGTVVVEQPYEVYETEDGHVVRGEPLPDTGLAPGGYVAAGMGLVGAGTLVLLRRKG